MAIDALIPARDEAPRIGGVLAALQASLPGVRIWVVDDGSRDGTGALAREAGARTIRTAGLGYGGALRVGYRALLEAGSQAVLQLDADGQHPPEAAPLLLRLLEEADIVFASRAGTASPGTLARRLGNAALARAVQGATGVALRDVTSGYWAMGPAALGLLARELGGGMADANVRVLVLRAGLAVREVPITMRRRDSGRSMHQGLAGALHLGRSLWAVHRLCRDAENPGTGIAYLSNFDGSAGEPSDS